MNNVKLIKKDIKDVYINGNWNSVYGFLKRNNIEHTLTIEEFGLSGKRSKDKMKKWLDVEKENEIRFPLYSILIKSKKTGFSYNILRGQQITLL